MTNVNKAEALQKLEDGLAKLDNLYSNLADQDVGDDLLDVANDAIEDLRNAQKLLSDN